MHYIRLLILYLGYTATVFLLIGLYKPWAMLWWEDVQNRKKIFQVYGTLMVLFYLLYWGLGFVK